MVILIILGVLFVVFFVIPVVWYTIQVFWVALGETIEEIRKEFDR